MDRLLVKADVVCPVSSGPIRDGAVAVEGGRIAAVGDARSLETAYPGFRKINAPGSVILPGFVNAHAHLELGWTGDRIGTFDGFTGWLERMIAVKSAPPDDGLVRESVASGLRETISCGVTTVGDICSPGSPGKEILRDSSVRAVAFVELFDRHLEDVPSLELVAEDLYEERLFPHAPYSCRPGLFDAAFAYAERTGVPLGTHLGESPDEALFLRNAPNGFERRIFPLIGKKSFARPARPTPAGYADGLMGDCEAKLTAVHMVQTDADDAETIRRRDMGVVLCPRSNVFIGVGEPDMRMMADLGRVGLGTDGLSSNADLDFFAEMRAARDMMEKRGVGRSESLAVCFATLGGAGALFIEERTGSLEVGKDADIVCVECGEAAVSDPYRAVLNSGPRNVVFSMAKGNFLRGEESVGGGPGRP